jgi:hypothetical protein
MHVRRETLREGMGREHHAVEGMLRHGCGREAMPVPGDTARASRRWRRGARAGVSTLYTLVA